LDKFECSKGTNQVDEYNKTTKSRPLTKIKKAGLIPIIIWWSKQMLKVVASFLSAPMTVMGPAKDISCFHFITRYLAHNKQGDSLCSPCLEG